jgi:anaerobic ribonucleoside-triphosphate reductase activating protein
MAAGGTGAQRMSEAAATMLSVGLEIADTEAEGPGRRYAIWVQGCPLRCPGCCNPELLPFAGGTRVAVGELAARVLATPGIEGVSLLGGEPFAQAAACAGLCEQVAAGGLGVMVFSGYTLDELQRQPGAGRLLAVTDLLVDGRFDRRRPDLKRRFIGSTNQQLHFLSDRYHPDDPRFSQPETIELRLSNGELIINGYPWPGLSGGRP